MNMTFKKNLFIFSGTLDITLQVFLEMYVFIVIRTWQLSLVHQISVIKVHQRICMTLSWLQKISPALNLKRFTKVFVIFV